jgi:glutathione peroxidase
MLFLGVAVASGQTDDGARAQIESEAATKMNHRSAEQKNATSHSEPSPEDQNEAGGSDGDYPLKFTMETLDGKEVNLSAYQGRPLLIVNTASKCGYTPQYKALQKLHEKYAGQGLQIVGFPCNQFRGQEPGDSGEIREFCEKNYGVSFDMFAKVDVKGDQQCDLYKYLTQQESSPKSSGDVTWNFEKFLVDGDGAVVARYASRVKPTAKRVTRAIEELLSDDASKIE